MMRALEFATIRTLDISLSMQSLVRTAHVPPGRGNFSFRDRHGTRLACSQFRHTRRSQSVAKRGPHVKLQGLRKLAIQPSDARNVLRLSPFLAATPQRGKRCRQPANLSLYPDTTGRPRRALAATVRTRARGSRSRLPGGLTPIPQKQEIGSPCNRRGAPPFPQSRRSGETPANKVRRSSSQMDASKNLWLRRGLI